MKHFKGSVPHSELADLTRVQNAWGDRATAILLVCQNCGATHMCKDGDGERRTISGMEATNKYDKAHNRSVCTLGSARHTPAVVVMLVGCLKTYLIGLPGHKA